MVEAAILLVLLCRDNTPGVAGRDELFRRGTPGTKLLGIRNVLVLLSEARGEAGACGIAVLGL